MGLKIGDTMTLNVLGREIEGSIANLRKVDFSNGGQNFILDAVARHHRPCAAFVSGDRARGAAEEDALYRAVTDKFPNISTVRVKDAIARGQRTAPAIERGRARGEPGHHPCRIAGAGGRDCGGPARSGFTIPPC